ncbi:MAG TPA: signal peptidase II [Bryobacteraceae bacterium]|nr:signal peptidase II [Bryobacteraceae bacterium]
MQNGHDKGRWTPLVIVGLVIALDRLTKLYIQHAVSSWNAIPVIPGLFRIVHTENPGAAFGILAEGNSLVRAAVLIGISSLVMIFVASALWSRSSSFTGAWTRFGLALILGGAIGNLLDRVVRGAVTDFLEVYNGTWSFPAFNVADSAITIGSIILLIELLRPRRRQVQPHVSETH